MKRSWIKFYVEILDDPKMGRLPDHIWRRCAELFLIAGEYDCDGLLPPVADMVWRLRITEEQMLEALHALVKLGIVHSSGDGWVISHFKDRQFSESYERVKRYRDRYSNADGNADGNADVAGNESPSSSTSPSYSSSEEEEECVGGETTEIPETPAEAKAHPDIQLYETVSGRFPGSRDYKVIIQTLQYLRKDHPDLQTYLVPYWTAWSTRKTREGKPYQASSLVWLCEWAMQGDIPRANGHEPRPGETAGSIDDVIKQVVQNDKNRRTKNR